MNFTRTIIKNLLLGVMIVTSACNKLSLQTEAKQIIEFEGIKSITKNSDGTYSLAWDAPAEVDISKLSFVIYSASKADDALSEATSTEESSSGEIVSLPDAQAPVGIGSLLATITGERSFQIPVTLKAGMTYLFQVRMLDAKGTRDKNQNVLKIHLVEQMRIVFAGLKSSGVQLANDNSKISLSWEPATNTTGKVSYAIYGDTNFSTPLAVITEEKYEFKNPEPGKSYTFGVRAQDDLGFETNQKFVIVDVPDPRDHTPPEFAGIVSASTVSDSKIMLRWAPSPSSDISGYIVYNGLNLNAMYGTTDLNYFMVSTGLNPANSYSFTVRAIDTSGNIDSNTVKLSAITLPYRVPDFGGLTKVSRLSGTAGLSQLALEWQPAAGTVTGYNVFMRKASQEFDFSSPASIITGALESSATISDLDPATEYFFVVRSFVISSGVNRTELNTIEGSNSTLSIRSPSFTGLSSVTAGEGSLGLSTLRAAWTDPAADGVYDGFKLSYEEGTCAQGFTAAAHVHAITDANARSYTVTGLSANQTYHFKVQAAYDPAQLLDSNQVCREGITTPTPPIFSGLTSVAVASGADGFTALNVTWPQAAGSFSQYRIEWSLMQNFSSIGGVTTVNSRSNTSTIITGLPVRTVIYVRVSANFNEAGLNLTAGSSRVLSAKTEPVAPADEGISSVVITAADSLTVSWTAPNTAGALYNGYKIWSYCGSNAATALNAKLSGPADATYASSVLTATFSGLSSDVNCCYQARAFYDDGTYTLDSKSTVPMACNTPTLAPPTFAGIKTLTDPVATIGFTQLTASWDSVSAQQAGLFSYYQIGWTTSPSATVNWASGMQVADRTQTSVSLSGLTPKTTYYVRVRAVNANGTPVASSGDTVSLSATTTPKSPTGDALSSAASLGSAKITLNYTPPHASSGGLYNNIFLFVASGSTSDVATFRSQIEASDTITASEIGAISSSRIATLASLPALIRIPLSDISTSGSNSIEVGGLVSGQQYCVQAAAVHWIDGQPEKYLKSLTPTTKCATPTAGAPNFSGVSALSGFNDARDFAQIKVEWPAITGDCTGVEISATLAANSPNFATPVATLSCTDQSKILTGLLPHRDYYIQVRAVNTVGGINYQAGQNIELSRKTEAISPTGDILVSATANTISRAADTVTLAWTEATSGTFNKTYIWKATASTAAAATTLVLAKALTKEDLTAPTAAPDFIVAKGTTSYVDASAQIGVYSCYIAKSVYADGAVYNAGLNETVRCATPDFLAPIFTGVASGSVVGNWPDGTAKIELTFNGVPQGSIEDFAVYYSPTPTLSGFGDLTAAPWQTVAYGSATYDSDTSDNKILVGGQGRTIVGTGYYLVRYRFVGLPTANVDNNVAISSAVTVPVTVGNYAYIAPELSGLAYGYYMMQYEAAGISGSYSSSDSVTSDETNLAICNAEFHQNKNPQHAACGTFASTRTLESRAGTTAESFVYWAQSFATCRINSNSGFLMRLPTEEEFDRSTSMTGLSYTAMSNIVGVAGNGNCNVTSGGPMTTAGALANCKSHYGIYDLQGNVDEFADRRMLQYSIASNSESRFGYGPTIGRSIQNGIDNRTRRYHLIDPGSTGRVLLKSVARSHVSVVGNGAHTPQLSMWELPTYRSNTLSGYRCVGFLAAKMPTMSELALPSEPTYTAADIPAGNPAAWKIPEPFFVKDTRPEELTITITGDPADAVAEGKININWQPWSKKVCSTSGICTSSSEAISYQIYRFIEPTLMALKNTVVPWALSGGSNNPYSADKPLDPLAFDSSGSPLYTANTTDGKLVATITACDSTHLGNCSFEDSSTSGTGFSPTKLYRYLLVAKDAEGNRMTAKVQRFRSKYYTDVTGFRIEPRYRQAGVFMVDEGYQLSRARPEVMVFVPMDKSGLDHDFFIQKFEASNFSGSMANETPVGSSAWPLQTSSGSWVNNAAVCVEKFMQSNNFDTASCGSGGVINTTSTTLQSKPGLAPLANLDQGAFWKACRNTSVADGDGAVYYFKLPSDQEWLQAADWGDLDHDGIIDVSALADNIGAQVTTLNFGAADTSTVRCHTDESPNSLLVSDASETANCRSRYGAADMVGNARESTDGQVYNGQGTDNGIEGLWFGVTFLTSGSSTASLKQDFFRAIPKASEASSVWAPDGYYYVNVSGLRGSRRGSHYLTTNNGKSGRFWHNVNDLASDGGQSKGARCVR